MAKQSIFDVIMKTIGDVQSKNQANPNEPTADPSIFDLLKEKLGELDNKSREKRTNRGKSPISILDRIKKEIDAARRSNAKDPNVETAPKSVFENLLKKIEDGPKRQASTGVRKIVEDYNLDVSKLPQEVFQQVQKKYQQDRKAFDKQYAQAIYDLARKYPAR
jgi:hypothetical protein